MTGVPPPAPGDLLLVNFPRTHAMSGSRRPALVLGSTPSQDPHAGTLLVLKVTSVQKRRRDARHLVEIVEWGQAGLAVPSIVACDRAFCIQPSNVLKRIGEVQPDTLTAARHSFLGAFPQLRGGLHNGAG